MKKTFFGGCRNVDEFEKIKPLGEGAFGRVYKARDKRKNEIVALKKIKIPPDFDGNGMPLTAFREIQILKACRHKNIVDLKDIVVGYKYNSIFLVFEFCEHDLGCLLDKGKSQSSTRSRSSGGTFSEAEVKTLMLQLFKSIKYLHDNNIVHRDIKLSNLLYTNKGELKLADFGLARVQNTFDKCMTPKVVTLWYRPPELLLGLPKYDGFAVDMWSCGCIFAELLLNKPLFPSKSELPQLNKIFNTIGVPSKEVWEKYCKFPKCNLLSQLKLEKSCEMNQKQREFINKKLRYAISNQRSVSHAADLLFSMLEFDPSKRISVDEAINHPYFTRCLPKPATMMPSFKGNFHKM